jgi:hypothetical protein
MWPTFVALVAHNTTKYHRYCGVVATWHVVLVLRLLALESPEQRRVADLPRADGVG